jgi:DNA-binding transcriptional ArsR family regulator
MSHSTGARAGWGPARRTGEEGPDDDHLQERLEALQDAECRAILSATSDAARSAMEVSTSCDIPKSTTYRKLNLLSDAGLLEEETRIRRTGKHTTVYRRAVDGLYVSVTDSGEFSLRCHYRRDDNRPIAPVDGDE